MWFSPWNFINHAVTLNKTFEYQANSCGHPGHRDVLAVSLRMTPARLLGLLHVDEDWSLILNVWLFQIASRVKRPKWTTAPRTHSEKINRPWPISATFTAKVTVDQSNVSIVSCGEPRWLCKMRSGSDVRVSPQIDLLPTSGGEGMTREFLQEIVNILMNYICKSYQRNSKVVHSSPYKGGRTALRDNWMKAERCQLCFRFWIFTTLTNSKRDWKALVWTCLKNQTPLSKY